MRALWVSSTPTVPCPIVCSCFMSENEYFQRGRIVNTVCKNSEHDYREYDLEGADWEN